MRNISQNLFFAFIYNAAGVPIAAGILYAAFGMVLSAVIAAAAMELSSVSVQCAAAAHCRHRMRRGGRAFGQRDAAGEGAQLFSKVPAQVARLHESGDRHASDW